MPRAYMRRKVVVMSKTISVASRVNAAQRVAPEDLRRGDIVVVADTDSPQVPPLDGGSWADRGAVRAVPVTYIPPDAGTPRRVLDVHLPFVFVREPCGYADTIDLRTTRVMKLRDKAGRRLFVRMHPDFARAAVQKRARRAARRLSKGDRKNA